MQKETKPDHKNTTSLSPPLSLSPSLSLYIYRQDYFFNNNSRISLIWMRMATYYHIAMHMLSEHNDRNIVWICEQNGSEDSFHCSLGW